MKSDVKSIRNERFLYFGSFRLNPIERLLFRNGEPVPLPAKAFDLLLLLVESAGHLRGREELIEALWPNTIVVENSLSWHIGIVRKTLGEEEGGESYIETVRGHGYRFIAPVTVESQTEAEDENGSEGAKVLPRRGRHEPTNADWRSRVWRTQTGVRFVLGIAAIVVIAGFLIWRLTPRNTAPQGGATTPVIAVLPFENMSDDRNNAYFADGIQDTILSKLAGIGGLRVISRTSTKHYSSHPTNLKKIASELGATAIMEGSVQKTEDQVLINVQLINPATDDHIWAQVYTRSLADIFAVENNVASQVAAALKTKLVPAEVAVFIPLQRTIHKPTYFSSRPTTMRIRFWTAAAQRTLLPQSQRP